MSVKLKGVYAIINPRRHRAYIGSSVHVMKRLGKHFNDLRSGRHHCIHLQRAWDKYGEDEFYWDVFDLGECDTPLFEREQVFIDQFWDSNNLYNTCRFAGDCRGVKQTEETKRKRAEKLRGSKRTDDQKARISAARKKVGITPEHAKLLAELAGKRRFRLSKAEFNSYASRIENGETQKSVAASIPICIKAFRREMRAMSK